MNISGLVIALFNTILIGIGAYLVYEIRSRVSKEVFKEYTTDTGLRITKIENTLDTKIEKMSADIASIDKSLAVLATEIKKN
jgi:uncharacterized membrane protein